MLNISILKCSQNVLHVGIFVHSAGGGAMIAGVDEEAGVDGNLIH